MDTDGSDRAAVARSAAEAGAAHALDAFRGDLEVDTKSGPTDLVTEADRDAEERVREVLTEQYPDEPIVGEEDESRGAVPESGPAWIVDPIDGTSNFVRGIQEWCTAVACVEDGEPVAAAVVAPALGDTYVADRERAERNGEPIGVSDVEGEASASICPTLTWPNEPGARATAEALAERFGNWRRFGAAQLELARVADGGLDAAVGLVRGEPWDTVAGVQLVRTAGGEVTDVAGERWRHDSTGLVASNGLLHDAARSVAARTHDERREEADAR